MRKILYILFIVFFHITAFAQADPDVIEFTFLTDTHKFGPSADIRYADANISEFVKYCQNTPSLKFALFGGDFMNAYDTNHKQALFCLERSRKDFVGIGIPFYATKGNHDCNGKQRTPDGRKDGTQIITDHEYFQLFSPISPTNPLADSTDIVYDVNNREGNYYYRDFPQQKFRLIVLNDYDRDSLEYFGYHGLQVKWVTEKALNFTDKQNPEDWCFIMVGHGLSVNIYEHPLNRIIHAYVRGEMFEDSDHGASYRADFHLQKRAKMVAFLAGHQHEDIYQRTEDYNMITMTRGFATGGEIESEPLCFSHFTLNTREKTLLEHRIGRGRDRMFTYDPHEMIWPVSSFKGAEGMGDLTHGGKDGRIITVTNLNDSGRGSLRWAVEQKGCRMVFFNVAGTINLKSPLVIANDSISILGQTAPGQGICLKGAPVKIQASEVCMRYLHVRPGEQSDGQRIDAISDGDFGQHNIILDHISVSFSSGHGIAIRRAKDVTVQYCIVSHNLQNGIIASADDEEGEPAGILAGGFMATYYKNLIANCANAMMFPNEEGQNRWIHVMRNMFYNWRDHAMYGGGRQGEISIEDNYLIPGAATQNTQVLDVAPDGTGRYYVSWNTVKGREELASKNWMMVNDAAALPYIPIEYDAAERAKMHPVQRPQTGGFGTSCVTIAAFHYKPVWYGKTAMQAPAVYRDILLQVGCSRVRDSYDNQLLENIRKEQPFGSDNGLISQTNKTLWPTIKSASEWKPQLSRENVNEWIENRVQLEKTIVILHESSAMQNLEMYPRLSGYRDAISADTSHVAVVCSGDIMGIINQGHPSLELIKHMKYDAIVPNSVDFSAPVNEIYGALSPVGPVVTSCNMETPKTRKNVFARYIMQQYGNRKVAYIGITTPYNLAEKNLVLQIQKCVKEARHAGANFVIAIANTSNTEQTDIKTILSQVDGIDATLENSPRNITKVIIANDGLVTTEVVPDSKMLFKNSVATRLLDAIKK